MSYIHKFHVGTSYSQLCALLVIQILLVFMQIQQQAYPAETNLLSLTVINGNW